MKDENQLVLFFRKGTKVDNVSLAKELKEKFPILAEPIVLPFNPNNIREPLIIFNQGKINLTVGISDVSFIYYATDNKEFFNTIIEIVECFENLDYSFERMGYVKTILHTKKERELLKENIFKDKDMIESEFQLSWYKKELIDSVKVNVWHKELTDILNNVELVTVFDINTPIDEEYYISSEFLNNFIKECEKYVLKKDKEYKQKKEEL